MYGVSKVAGEHCSATTTSGSTGSTCAALRYPGLVSYEAFSGGGTTDYSVEMFFEAKRRGRYTCFVRADTMLPLMYMDDAIRATVEVMEAPAERLTVRTSYNLGGAQLHRRRACRGGRSQRFPASACEFVPDFRQAIANSWPMTVDDSAGAPRLGLAGAFRPAALVDTMLSGVEQRLAEGPA